MNISRTNRLEPGVFVAFRGGTWRVAGLSATTAHLTPYGTDQAPEERSAADAKGDAPF